MKVAVAESPPGLPVTLIVCEPNAAVPLTVNEPVNCPLLEMLHADNVTIAGNGVSVIAPGHTVAVSTVLNPLPVTVTTVLTGPDVGLSVIEGEVLTTVNVAVAESPAAVPVTVITYVPAVAGVKTVNVEVGSKLPLVM
jgi:hypothetical protein